jgi:hypothetical protein
MKPNHTIKITIRVEPFSGEYHADIKFNDKYKYISSNEMKVLLEEIKVIILKHELGDK